LTAVSALRSPPLCACMLLLKALRRFNRTMQRAWCARSLAAQRPHSTLRCTLKAARIEALSDVVLRKVLGAQTHERAPFLPDWTKLWGYAPGGGLRPKKNSFRFHDFTKSPLVSAGHTFSVRRGAVSLFYGRTPATGRTLGDVCGVSGKRSS
jgi:hypothetical protein